MTNRVGSEAGLDDRPRRVPGSEGFPSLAGADSDPKGAGAGVSGYNTPHVHIPQISRMIKACAACRKQKAGLGKDACLRAIGLTVVSLNSGA